jgi:hypothetical protein
MIMEIKTIDTFPYPKQEWDFQHPSFLLYDLRLGWVIGACLLTDEEDQTFEFRYGCESHLVKPTHWCELPPKPV